MSPAPTRQYALWLQTSHWCALLASPSIFQGAAAGLAIQVGFGADMSALSWQRKKGQSLW